MCGPAAQSLDDSSDSDDDEEADDDDESFGVEVLHAGRPPSASLWFSS